jgi:hypothetical protein
MGRKLDQGIKGGEGNQKPEGRPKQPFIASNGWRYEIVAHFETQTYQPDKPLIKCYFVQI